MSKWITRTYPIIVVDELQDSKSGQLRMLQELTNSATCLAAADDFQDLEADGENEAVSWALKNGEVVPLLQIHRTNVQGLLEAASALREGRELTNGSGFEIVSVPKPQLGAWHVSKHIKKWRPYGTLAIITPTGPDKSPFVRELVERVEAGPIGQTWKHGPYVVPWEVSHQSAFKEFMDELGIPDDPDEKVSIEQINLKASHGPTSALSNWLNRKRNISGRDEFSVAEVYARVDLIQQRIRAFGHSWERRFSAMTTHQAKNREFESVIIFWPFQVYGSEERHRRLLYNAITRAKKRAVLIVQDPKQNRLRQTPFTAVS
jgi:superfamily I DNA/RNA helicase